MITTMPQQTAPIAPMIPVPIPSKPKPAHDCTETLAPPRAEWYEAYHCPECDEITINTGYALYECADCGTHFTRVSSADGCSHRCPDCNKFSAKISDHACYECEEAEADIVWVYDCPVCEDQVLAPDQEADRV